MTASEGVACVCLKTSSSISVDLLLSLACHTVCVVQDTEKNCSVIAL